MHVFITFIHIVWSSVTSGMLFMTDTIPGANTLSKGLSFGLTALNTAIQSLALPQKVWGVTVGSCATCWRDGLGLRCVGVMVVGVGVMGWGGVACVVEVCLGRCVRGRVTSCLSAPPSRPHS